MDNHSQQINFIKNKLYNNTNNNKMNFKLLNFLDKNLNTILDNYLYLLLEENQFDDNKHTIGYINYLVTTLKLKNDKKITYKIYNYLKNTYV